MNPSLTQGSVEAGPPPPSTKKRAIRAMFIVAILVGGISAFQLGSRIALATEDAFFVVVSPSMVPALRVGDEIVVRGDPFSSLKVSDIIVFHNPKLRFDATLREHCQVNPEDIPCVIVHRVYAISDDDQRKITTKGDSNSRPDSLQVIESDYIGKVIFTIPYIGYLSVLIKYPYNYVLIAVILAFVFITEFMSSEKRAK